MEVFSKTEEMVDAISLIAVCGHLQPAVKPAKPGSSSCYVSKLPGQDYFQKKVLRPTRIRARNMDTYIQRPDTQKNVSASPDAMLYALPHLPNISPVCS